MRKYLIGIGAAAIIAVAAGCGGSDNANDGGDVAGVDHGSSAAAADTAGHNEQDMSFAQMMIPHHQQAIDMAKLAGEKASDATVKDLATRIQGAQDPEIRQMTDMLDQWGASMNDGSGSDMPGMDHGGMSMPGMMTDAEMQQLEKATGAAFDTMWVQMMIKHHQGAIDMANDELKSGSNSDAKELAQKIIDAQQDEIDEMNGMLS
jgi:uncharacterized protein (DUF305 family)